METFIYNGQEIQAENREEAKRIARQMKAQAEAQQIRRKAMESRPVLQRTLSGAVDPFIDAYYGGKQLLTGKLSDEEMQRVSAARERLETGGIPALVGEAATWAIPFGAAAKIGSKALQVGGRMLPKAVGAVGGEAALEGMFQASRTQMDGDPSRLERGLTGATTGAVGGAIGETVSRGVPRLAKALSRPAAMTPQAMRIERLGRDMGAPINLTAGQSVDPRTVTGGIVRGLEEMSNKIPGGGPLRKAQETAMGNWNLAEIRNALPERLRGSITEAGPKGFSQVQQTFSRAYKEALEPLGDSPITVSDEMLDRLASIEKFGLRRIKSDALPAARKEIDNLLDDLVDEKITGSNFKEWVRELGKSEQRAWNQGDKEMARYLSSLRKLVVDEVSERIGDNAPLLREVDEAYGRIVPMIEAGAMKGAINAGFFDPNQLMSGAMKGQSRTNKAAANSLAAERALAAQSVFGTTLPRVGPGTAEKMATQAALGGLAGAGLGVMSGQGVNPSDAALGSLAGMGLGSLLPRSRNALLGRTKTQRILRQALDDINRKARKLQPITSSGAITYQRDDD